MVADFWDALPATAPVVAAIAFVLVTIFVAGRTVSLVITFRWERRTGRRRRRPHGGDD